MSKITQAKKQKRAKAFKANPCVFCKNALICVSGTRVVPGFCNVCQEASLQVGATEIQIPWHLHVYCPKLQRKNTDTHWYCKKHGASKTKRRKRKATLGGPRNL